MVRKLFKPLLFIVAASIFLLPQISMGLSGQKPSTKKEKVHQFTGVIQDVDINGGVIILKGKGGNRSFMASSSIIGALEEGKKVRLYYIRGMGKKPVVTRVKKVNNVESGKEE